MVFAIALALAACDPTAARKEGPSRKAQVADTAPGRLSWPDTTRHPTRDSVLKVLHEYGQWFGDDRATVISRLGAPRRVTAKAASSGLDTLYVLEYPGASFLIHRQLPAQTEILPEFRVWGPLLGLPLVPALGATTRSQLVTMLGPPGESRTQADTIVFLYRVPRPENTDLLEFFIVRDTVRLARWRYYMEY